MAVSINVSVTSMTSFPHSVGEVVSSDFHLVALKNFSAARSVLTMNEIEDTDQIVLRPFDPLVVIAVHKSVPPIQLGDVIDTLRERHVVPEPVADVHR